jgi:uncharacterized membrane protein
MQTQLASSRITNISRWFIPLAAVLAIAAWFYVAPEGALGKLDAVGYAVCHRIEARSFHIGERQLPLCARCTGEFFAAGIGLVFMGFVSGKRSRHPSRGILAILTLFFLAFALDGSNSYLYLLKQTSRGAFDQIPNLYVPNNTLRLFTGSGMGIAIAAVLYPVINQTLWRQLDHRPALEWKSFGILAAFTAIFDLLILTENPIVLYPAAYVSALGALSLLAAVFGILWIIIMKADNTYETPGQLWLPLAAGLTLSLLLILGIDLLRLNLTGTWGGFPGIGG